MVEFKIEDLMTNLEYRSKMLKDSVKFKEDRRPKNKSNLMFPSSFYGIKQQFSAKKTPPINPRSTDQAGLTIKNFMKKWSGYEALKQKYFDNSIIFFIRMYSGHTGQDSNRDFRLDEEVTKIENGGLFTKERCKNLAK